MRATGPGGPNLKVVSSKEGPHGMGCDIVDLFRLLGKPYTMDILFLVTRENPAPWRFVDLQKRLQLSPNTLSERLKELVENGLLTRTAYNEIPPRVDYAATAKAKGLKPVFKSLWTWCCSNTLEPVEVTVKAPK